jgi:hypothetical protein
MTPCSFCGRWRTRRRMRSGPRNLKDLELANLPTTTLAEVADATEQGSSASAERQPGGWVPGPHRPDPRPHEPSTQPTKLNGVAYFVRGSSGSGLSRCHSSFNVPNKGKGWRSSLFVGTPGRSATGWRVLLFAWPALTALGWS